MELFLRLFVLTSAVSFINSQYPVKIPDVEVKPEKCYGSADILNEQCCILPPFFARDVANKCGSTYRILQDDVAHNITYRRRQVRPGCDTWVCIIKEYEFINKDEEFDHDKYYAHLDRWVELNPEFVDVMDKVKASCKEMIEPYLPLEPCEFKRLHFCIRHSIEMDCPMLKNSETCLKQKAFYEDCREYFVRK